MPPITLTVVPSGVIRTAPVITTTSRPPLVSPLFHRSETDPHLLSTPSPPPVPTTMSPSTFPNSLSTIPPPAIAADVTPCHTPAPAAHPRGVALVPPVLTSAPPISTGVRSATSPPVPLPVTSFLTPAVPPVAHGIACPILQGLLPPSVVLPASSALLASLHPTRLDRRSTPRWPPCMPAGSSLLASFTSAISPYPFHSGLPVLSAEKKRLDIGASRREVSGEELLFHRRDGAMSSAVQTSWDDEHFVAAVQQKVSECAHSVSNFGERFACDSCSVDLEQTRVSAAARCRCSAAMLSWSAWSPAMS